MVTPTKRTRSAAASADAPLSALVVTDAMKVSAPLNKQEDHRCNQAANVSLIIEVDCCENSIAICEHIHKNQDVVGSNHGVIGINKDTVIVRGKTDSET